MKLYREHKAEGISLCRRLGLWCLEVVRAEIQPYLWIERKVDGNLRYDLVGPSQGPQEMSLRVGRGITIVRHRRPDDGVWRWRPWI